MNDIRDVDKLILQNQALIMRTLSGITRNGNLGEKLHTRAFEMKKMLEEIESEEGAS